MKLNKMIYKIGLNTYTMENKEKKYAMVQLDVDLHRALKAFCKKNGFQIKGFIQAKIRQALKNTKLN